MKKTLILTAFLLSAACSKNNQMEPARENPNFPLTSVGEFSVTDEAGNPLTAQILIGKALNDPFTNNLLTTGTDGKASAPKEWTDAQPVTVHVPGFIDVTYLEQKPRMLNFKLRRAQIAKRMELSGQTAGYNLKDRDNLVDFGMVMKGLTKAEILAFDINKVVSLEMDTLEVVGYKVPIPSNISLPKQKESYVIPITIDKNPFRVYFNEMGSQPVLGIRGKFPFKEVINELRNKTPYVDLINYFTLEGGTFQTVNISGPTQSLPSPLNMSQWTFNSSVKVTAPTVGTGEVVIALIAQDINGVLMPTDVKKLTSGQSMNLKAKDSQTAQVVKVLKRSAEFDATSSPYADRLSAVVTNVQNSDNSQFLGLVESPRLQGADLILDVPKTIPNVEPYTTYMVLSELQKVDIGNGKQINVPTHRWEVYAPGWIGQMSLPQRPFTEDLANPQWRWEVSFLGGSEQVPPMGPQMIEKTTHVTRSSVDF